jgi:hypothetical protein
VLVEVGTNVSRPRTCVLAAGAEAVHVAAAVGLEVPTVASPGNATAGPTSAVAAMSRAGRAAWP